MPWLAIAFVAGWSALVLATSSSQWGDHFEQFVWAHGVEWGYHKHPPLPTWMLATTIAFFGTSLYWAYALAFLCTAATACFTYGIARRLLGQETAVLALLLWGLQHAFSARAALFNHNTVAMSCVSAAVWFTLRALELPRRGWAWWLATGAAAGLSLLAKYQAIVGLAGLFAALAASGDLASTGNRRGLALATVVGSIVFLPHLAWVARDHFSSIDYALQTGRFLDAGERLRNVFSFLAQQVRMLLPALLLVGFIALLRGRWPVPVAGRTPAADASRQRRWLLGLVAIPFAITVLSGPLLGLELQNHWGYQALQFAGLWLARHARRHVPPAGLRWLAAASLVHAFFMGLALAPALRPQTMQSRRVDGAYPAQALADAVRRDWAAITTCPLDFVVGPSFEAGMVSVYSGGHAAVLEDGDLAKSPWIDAGELQRRGAVYVATDPAALPRTDAVPGRSLAVHLMSPARSRSIYWVVVAPLVADDCAVKH